MKHIYIGFVTDAFMLKQLFLEINFRNYTVQQIISLLSPQIAILRVGED